MVSNQAPTPVRKRLACAPKPISRESQRVLDESITWVRATEEEIIRRWQLEHANDEFPAEVSETTGKRRPDKSQLTKYHKQRRLKGPSKVVIRLDYTRVPKHRSTGVLVPEGAVSSPATSSTPTATNFIPVGEPYYKLLRASWTGEAGAAVPPNSKVGPVDAPVFYGNDQEILDSIDEGTRPPFQDPVPLDAMLEFLASEWESEGLYAAQDPR